MSSNATVTDTYFWRVLDGLPDNDLVLDMVLGIILSVFTGQSFSASIDRNPEIYHPSFSQ